MSLTLTTKLDAVNQMLESVWELPVSTLIGSASGAVAMAKRVLDQTCISVQTRGWAFNTEDNFVLSPDTSGNINVPSTALEVDPSGVDCDVDAVVRGTRLYDRENHTFTFTKPVNCRIISLLDFEDLPQAARFYIATMAARSFYNKYKELPPTSPTQEEIEALRDLEEHEAQVADSNMFTGSYSVGNILDR